LNFGLIDESIRNDIESEELRPEDIVVINPDPIKTQEAVGKVRRLLFGAGINSEIAGVSTSRDVFSKDGAVTFTGIFRAKGNEAGMIYVLNAQDCYSAFTKSQLALIRNRLFTALTRSKGWVRVLGVGTKMDSLTEEWSLLKAQDYKLKFKYPTVEEKKLLRLINVEPTAKQTARERRLKQQRDELLQAIREGDIDVDQLLSDFRSAGKGASKK
jgi:superfamily I DNA and RNA helicase